GGSGFVTPPGYALLLLVARFPQLAQNAVEVLNRREADLDGSLSRRQVDLDLRVEAIAELFRDLVEVGTARTLLRLGLLLGLLARFEDPLGGSLGRTHRELLVDDLVGQLRHGLRVAVQRENGAGLARGEDAGRNALLNGLREPQEADRVGDLGPRTADAIGQLVLRDAEIVD